MKRVRLLLLVLLACALVAPASASASAEHSSSAAAQVAATTAGQAEQEDGDPAGERLSVVVRTEHGLDVRRLPAGAPGEAEEALRRLRALDSVVAAERDVPVKALGDPLRQHQWGLDRLHAEQAWTSTQASGQKVAVVDTGVDAAHPDLAGVVLSGYDAFTPGGDGRNDANGHGTHVAGIVAAVSGNGIGVEGLARSAKILPVKVLQDDGSGYSSDVAEGILWAIANGATVVNLSLGSPNTSSSVDAAIEQAIQKGVVVVAASGNEGAKGNPVMWPAALPEVVSVGAIDSTDQRASFSGHGDWLDLVAPGVQIASTMSGEYMYSSGTSMAAPFVSATAALVRTRYPSLTPPQLADHLLATAEDLGPAGEDPEYGVGLVDTVKALTTAPPGLDLQAKDAVTPVAATSDLVRGATEVSRTAFPATAAATVAVLARDDAFADSLAGSALASTDGPILYTTGGPDAPLRAETATELTRVLAPGGVVHVLGGPGAVSERAVADVQALGFTVVRLQGPSRVETALAIADAVSPAPSRVMLARADQWADAVTGGAYAASSGVPLLLTQSDSLHPAVAAWLAAKRPSEVILLGGESALSANVAAAVPGRATRVSGPTRAGTAVAVAKSLWGRRDGAPGDRFVAVDGFASDSWSPALAASVLSARQAAPQILVNGGAPSTVSPETEAYLTELGYSSSKSATAYLVGPKVGAGTEDSLNALLTQ
ncbi:MAG TPA: S8 family serine peptidase [Egibacteraceae bacterium]|nr:S8 family serine peptidase [Egibacteraceae bacterium]